MGTFGNSQVKRAAEVGLSVGDFIEVQLGGKGRPVRVFGGKVRFAEVDGLEVVVRMAVADDHGRSRLVCTAVDARCRAEPGGYITGEQLDLSGYIHDAARHLTRRMAAPGRVAKRLGPSRATEVALAPKYRPGRPPVAADEYEHAARIYRDAQAAGRPTTRAVADGLGVSESTARKRVHEARRRGLLPKAGTTRPRL